MFLFSPANTRRRDSLVVLALVGANLLGGVTAACAQTAAAPAPAKAAAPKPPTPKITAKQAEAAAAKKIGGKAKSSVYEFEDNRWQWAVIVKDKKGQMYEVAVNATTGAIMDTEKTSAGEEAKEAAADKKAAMGGMSKAPKEKADEKGEKAEKPGK